MGVKGELYYTISGHGPAVVFIHGYCDNSLVWAPIVGSLSRFTFLAIDLPGHGLSGVSLQEEGFDGVCQQIFQIAHQYNLGKLILVGHSMGGYVAVAFAKLYPDSVEQIFLLHSHPFADSAYRQVQRQKEIGLIERGKLPLLLQMQLDSRFEGLAMAPELMEMLAPINRGTSKEGALWALKAMMHRRDLSDWLLKSKISVVCGLSRYDNKVDYHKIVSWAAQAPNVTIVDFEFSRHMCFWEEQDLFVATFMKFAVNK